MSTVKIQGSPTGTGNVTLVAPVTNSDIDITLPSASGALVSTGSIGDGTLTMNTSGVGLSGSQTFTANQTGNATFTVASNATNANTASTIVARDGSGNFSAGTITAALSGTATQVSNSLTLATSGTGLSGSATFNGASAQTFTVTSNATNANTASTIVARDGSGNFSAGTITATLSGNASTATTATNQSGGTVNATTGAFSSTITSSFAPAAFNTTTPGLTNYGFVFNGASSTDNAQGLTWSWTNGGGAQAGIYVRSSGAYGTRMYIATTDSFATGARSALYVGETGIVQTLRNYFEATSSARAPIFYDSNDTGFYVDPANGGFNLRGGSSNRVTYATTDSGVTVQNAEGVGANVRLGAAWSRPGTYSNTSYTLGGETSIHFWLAGGEKGYIDTSNNLFMNGSMRAPIFYDLNNTGYYSDPASTSNLHTAVFNNTAYSYSWWRSYNQTGWYNESYAGGIYMLDSTWIRTYNGKYLYVDSYIACAGNITAYYSDERLKTKLGKIENALDKVCSLEGFVYEENELALSLMGDKRKGVRQVGLSAQAVQKVQPEVVSLAPFDIETDEHEVGKMWSKSGEDYLTVDYSRIVPLLVEAIKELRAEVQRLKGDK